MAKGKGGATVAIVEGIARPVVERMGYRLWDVRYEKEGPDHFLRVFIDKDGPMSTEDCEAVSRALDPLIDEADPIEESYYFEVSSPGLGRRLVRPEHFAAVLGQKVALRLYRAQEDGEKEFAGTLTAADAEGVTLDTPQGERSFTLSQLALAKLCDDEDLF